MAQSHTSRAKDSWNKITHTDIDNVKQGKKKRIITQLFTNCKRK